jgi:hypothetical protein
MHRWQEGTPLLHVLFAREHPKQAFRSLGRRGDVIVRSGTKKPCFVWSALVERIQLSGKASAYSEAIGHELGGRGTGRRQGGQGGSFGVAAEFEKRRGFVCAAAIG